MFRPEAAQYQPALSALGNRNRVMCATPRPLLASKVTRARPYIFVAEVAR